MFHGSYDESKWKVQLIDTGLDTLKGGRIKKLEPYLFDEINMITYGDGLANVDLGTLLSFHKAHGKTVTFTGVRPTGRFGEFEEENSRVHSFREKPEIGHVYVNGGFMVFNKRLLKYLTDSESCDFEFGALEKLANMGEVMVFKHDGDWACMDNERDVEHLNTLWREKKAFWKVW